MKCVKLLCLVFTFFLLVSFNLPLASSGLRSSSSENNLNCKETEEEQKYLDIAQHWAPSIYHDTDSSDYDADYMTNIDFDGDWVSTNNWENQPDYPNKGYVYYWLQETDTHWFIGYMVFHPRDWVEWDLDLDQHENDIEEAIICIKKDGSRYGSFISMITNSHGDVMTYTDSDNHPSSNVTGDGKSIDGDVEFEDGHHPYIYIEAKGHSILGAERWEDNDFPGDDGVVYHVSDVAEEPSSGNDRNVSYKLKDIDEVWERRYNYDELFYHFHSMQSDTHSDGSAANPPWARGKGDMNAPTLFTDMAAAFDVWFDDMGKNYSYAYIGRNYEWEGVMLWEEKNFGGSGELIGYDDQDLSDNVIGSDSVSSIEFVGEWKDTPLYIDIYEESGFGGNRSRLYGSVLDLSSTKLGQDETTSIRCTAEKDNFTLELTCTSENQGWNLVSTSLIRKETSLETVISDWGINSSLDKVMSFENGSWFSYMPGRPDTYNQDIKVEEDSAFWVRVTENVTVVNRGYEPISTEIELNPGWNLVGYPCNGTDVTLPEAVTKAGCYSASEEYNLDYTQDMGNMTFKKGRGYWLYNSHADTITWELSYD